MTRIVELVMFHDHPCCIISRLVGLVIITLSHLNSTADLTNKAGSLALVGEIGALTDTRNLNKLPV